MCTPQITHLWQLLTTWFSKKKKTICFYLDCFSSRREKLQYKLLIRASSTFCIVHIARTREAEVHALRLREELLPPLQRRFSVSSVLPTSTDVTPLCVWLLLFSFQNSCNKQSAENLKLHNDATRNLILTQVVFLLNSSKNGQSKNTWGEWTFFLSVFNTHIPCRP